MTIEQIKWVLDDKHISYGPAASLEELAMALALALDTDTVAKILLEGPDAIFGKGSEYPVKGGE